MGRWWRADEGKINEKGHRWKYVTHKEYEWGIAVTFICMNGCPTVLQVPCNPDSGMDLRSVCFTPDYRKQRDE